MLSTPDCLFKDLKEGKIRLLIVFCSWHQCLCNQFLHLLPPWVKMRAVLGVGLGGEFK